MCLGGKHWPTSLVKPVSNPVSIKVRWKRAIQSREEPNICRTHAYLLTLYIPPQKKREQLRIVNTGL